MAQEFGDEQIRLELKRLVEQFHAATLTKLNGVESEARTAEGATELEVRKLRDKVKASKALLLDRTQQMTDFIERQ